MSPGGYLILFVTSLAAFVIIPMIFLYRYHRDLKEREEFFRLLAENAHDLVHYYRLHPNPGFEYVSPSSIKFNGYTPEEHYADPNLIYKSVHPDDQHYFQMMGKATSVPGKALSLRFVHKDGHIVWTEQKYNYSYDKKGTIIGIYGIIRDVTERWNVEQQLEYIGLHDALTGLFNRAYFKHKIDLLNEPTFSPVGIIICDLDGLKLINDSMGHAVGDKLLIAAAEALDSCSGTEDIVSRIGGDEFAIIMPQSSEKRIQEVCHNIRSYIETYRDDDTGNLLSMSVGYAVKMDESSNLMDTLRKADNNMYREKLYRSQTIRSSIVKNLTSTLKERDYITEGHADRLQTLVSLLAKHSGMSKQRIMEMRLLAHFHDIGKVAIPDRILFKPGPLTEDEKLEMQRHSEIGFRLAQSGPELISMADFILKHHEWWNGKGYPLGLSGEDIPLECRILAIADAYDAMISNRPYRQGISHEEALKELQKGAGTQFDPELVDKFVGLMIKKPEQE